LSQQQTCRSSSVPAEQPSTNCITLGSNYCCTSSSFNANSSFKQQRHGTTCAAAAGDRSQPVASSLASSMQQLLAALDALYRFSRPHTMLGTFVSIVSVSSMALGSAAWSAAAVAGLCQALVPALLMNVAIVGINQVYDVEIDKVRAFCNAACKCVNYKCLQYFLLGQSVRQWAQGCLYMKKHEQRMHMCGQCTCHLHVIASTTCASSQLPCWLILLHYGSLIDSSTQRDTKVSLLNTCCRWSARAAACTATNYLTEPVAHILHAKLHPHCLLH
jgi:hypothetical protein